MNPKSLKVKFILKSENKFLRYYVDKTTRLMNFRHVISTALGYKLFGIDLTFTHDGKQLDETMDILDLWEEGIEEVTIDVMFKF